MPNASRSDTARRETMTGIRLGDSDSASAAETRKWEYGNMIGYVHDDRDWREVLNGRLEHYLSRQDQPFEEEEERGYPGEESGKHRRDVEPCHNEEIKNAVLEDSSHQPGQTRLALIGFELRDEEDDANEGDQVCD